MTSRQLLHPYSLGDNPGRLWPILRMASCNGTSRHCLLNVLHILAVGLWWCFPNSRQADQQDSGESKMFSLSGVHKLVQFVLGFFGSSQEGM